MTSNTSTCLALCSFLGSHNLEASAKKIGRNRRGRGDLRGPGVGKTIGQSRGDGKDGREGHTDGRKAVRHRGNLVPVGKKEVLLRPKVTAGISGREDILQLSQGTATEGGLLGKEAEQESQWE